jgi:hypothetical protein
MVGLTISVLEPPGSTIRKPISSVHTVHICSFFQLVSLVNCDAELISETLNFRGDSLDGESAHRQIST